MLEALSKPEAAYVAGLEASVVDRAIDQRRFGRPFVSRRTRVRQVRPAGAFLIAAGHLMARDVGAGARLRLRRRLELELRTKPIAAMREIEVPATAVPLRVD